MINFISNNKDKIIFILSISSLFLSYYFNEDGTGGGARGDFEVTYGFIIALQDNLLSDPKDWTLVHTPLHFVLLSFVTRIISDTDLLRLLFCFFSIILPIFFFVTLILSNSDKSVKKNILILSSAILFIPSFRYTSIWANDLITSLVFFIISIYFFKKWENNPKKNLDMNSFFQIFFFSASYIHKTIFCYIFYIFFI